MTTVELAQALWLLVAALGLSLSVQYAGLPVLGQGAFVAVGGVGTALLGPGGAGWPLGLAALAAVVVAGGLGHLVAFGASRLEGAYLALATWALAWLAYRLMLAFPSTFGGAQGLVRRAPAHVVSPALGLDVRLTPAVHVGLAAVTCVVVILAVIRLDKGPAGLDLAALREGPELAASLGVPVAAHRRAVLTATASLGAVSGAGTVVLLGLVAPADVSPLLSLQLFVAVLLGGAAGWWGPVLGVALLTVLPHVADALPGDAERARGVLTAVLLVVVLVIRRVLSRVRVAVPDVGRERPVPAPHVPHDVAGTHPVLLEASGITASYGAVRAVDEAAIELRAGQVHALIGPNGSGKSTLIKVLAGELVPDAGAVLVGGRAPTGRGPAARVLAGVAATPQRTVLLAGSAPERQVAVGVRGGTRPRHAVLRHLLGTPSSRLAERRSRALVAAVLRETRLSAVAGVSPTELTVGEQRLLQIARALATGARVLLLDEPAAGMSADERATLRHVLRRLAGNGLAVLVVEHDMRLVNAVADRVTVLDAGRVIAVGRPAEVRASPDVQRAYLGVTG
ncbi:MAG: branched-chain amino acid transport system ATP-binding protein livF [Actinomycetota bacterium]|jgi:ABC-type branched-subunit amino acid transport system ATPase component/ABC-type branched-subunit amino acid transport system permease subunit|nr:branched-chain amino acid transport system ATP-binding protein livF [Actinomycetota bacterium]